MNISDSENSIDLNDEKQELQSYENSKVDDNH